MLKSKIKRVQEGFKTFEYEANLLEIELKNERTWNYCKGALKTICGIGTIIAGVVLLPTGFGVPLIATGAVVTSSGGFDLGFTLYTGHCVNKKFKEVKVYCDASKIALMKWKSTCEDLLENANEKY